MAERKESLVSQLEYLVLIQYILKIEDENNLSNYMFILK